MQYAVNIGGHRVILTKHGQPLEELFQRFHLDYFTKGVARWDELAVAATEYFEKNAASTAAHDDYFNNFITLWQVHLGEGRYDLAESIWENALRPALAWESPVFIRISSLPSEPDGEYPGVHPGDTSSVFCGGAGVLLLAGRLVLRDD